MKGRSNQAATTVEPLERRRLMSVTVENLPVPIPSVYDYSSEGATVSDLTLGSDQYVWYNSNRSGLAFTFKVNKKGRAVDSVPDLAVEADEIGAVAAGPDGYTFLNTAVLFDDIRPGRDLIYKVSRRGNVDEFDVADYGSGRTFQDMAVASDGSVLYAYPFDQKIYRTTGSDTDVVLATITGNVQRMVTAADGSIWFTETGARRIGHLTTRGKLTEYKVPTDEAYDIAPGPDGALWFTEPAANKVGRIDQRGRVSEYALPTGGAVPSGITGGPAGSNTVWFTEPGQRRLGSIRTDGSHIKELALGRSMRGPNWITAGNDGRIYFSRVGGLSRVTITPAPVATASAAAVPAVSRSLQRAASFSTLEFSGSGRHPWDD
ncbi:MAG: putative antibiotic hydrolase [Phycisphaerales bacterium]|nr:putative antibiotic hydrolase [Phycisphaerales bacterium]